MLSSDQTSRSAFGHNRSVDDLGPTAACPQDEGTRVPVRAGQCDENGRADYFAQGKAIGAAYREAFGSHYPAMAVVEVSNLVEAAAMVEIEATAVVAEG